MLQNSNEESVVRTATKNRKFSLTGIIEYFNVLDLQSGTKKTPPLKMDVLFSLGLNHSAYVKNEQNPPYNDL